MNIEKIKANAPKWAQYFNAEASNGSYYRIIGEVAQYYSESNKEWVDSIGYTKEEVQESFIDLRETASVWTPENNTLPFGELTREQKISLLATWVDGCNFYAAKSMSSEFIRITDPSWHSDFIYRAKKSPRAAFIEQCKNLTAAEIYDAIKSGKLKVEKGE